MMRSASDNRVSIDNVFEMNQTQRIRNHGFSIYSIDNVFEMRIKPNEFGIIAFVCTKE